MINIVRKLCNKMRADFINSYHYIYKLINFENQRIEFINKENTKRFSDGADYLCLDDANNQIPFDAHYFYHPAWAARVLKTINPLRHIDISSIFSFSGFISAFWETEYYEFQPIAVKLEGLSTGKIDLCSLPFDSSSISSLSCMHVLEHVGLGRYGDQIDPDGDVKAAAELSRVLAPGGHLLFVTPIAETARIEFNAHRIYSHDDVIKLFPDLKLREFSVVLDNTESGLVRNADTSLLKGQRYACGCYHFVRE